MPSACGSFLTWRHHGASYGARRGALRVGLMGQERRNDFHWRFCLNNAAVSAGTGNRPQVGADCEIFAETSWTLGIQAFNVRKGFFGPKTPISPVHSSMTTVAVIAIPSFQDPRPQAL